MARYAAFLRGVSPMNAKKPELKEAFEAAGLALIEKTFGKALATRTWETVAQVAR